MSFHVSFNDSTLARLSALKELVTPLGLGKELARVLVAVVKELQQRPLESGEILYEYHHVPIRVKAHVQEYLSVVFGVHEESKSVMVMRISMREDNPFPKEFGSIFNE